MADVFAVLNAGSSSLKFSLFAAAGTLVAVRLALSSRSRTTSAPGVPSMSCNWPWISPRAASSPKKKPAIEITISSSGAIEKMV